MKVTSLPEQQQQNFNIEFDAAPHTHFEFQNNEGDIRCVVYEADFRIINYDAYQYKEHELCAICGGTGPFANAAKQEVVTYDHIEDVLFCNTVMMCPECNATHASSPRINNDVCAVHIPAYPDESAIIPAEFGNKFNLIRNNRWDESMLSNVNPLFVEHIQYGDTYYIPRRYTHWELGAIKKVFVLAYKERFSIHTPYRTRFMLRSFLQASNSDCYESIALLAMQCDAQNPPSISRVFDSKYIDVHKLLKLYRDYMCIRNSVAAKDTSRSMLVKRKREVDAPPIPKHRKYEEELEEEEPESQE
jgi:hypothetical protein